MHSVPDSQAVGCDPSFQVPKAGPGLWVLWSLSREPSGLFLAGFLAAVQPHAEPSCCPRGQASLGLTALLSGEEC